MSAVNSRGFASDNNSGVHPEVLEAMAKVNSGHTIAYGDDPYTASARKVFKEVFGEGIEVYFVFTGTGANVLGLKTLTDSFHSVICAETAHINEDECGAPEKFTGCKLRTIHTEDGKISAEQIRPFLRSFGFEHHAQPMVVSVTQATELGTVYRPEELAEIAGFAHEHGMKVHMDGARVCNAAAALDLPLRAITGDVGIDVLSFGGTKNGLMYGEAVVFFDKTLCGNFKYIRKQGMQLASKMRFMAAQFEAFFSNDLWLRSSRHANSMARFLAGELSKIPGVKVTRKVEANGVFAIIHRGVIPRLQEEFFFYVWDEDASEVRLMASFDTTEDDIVQFTALLKKCIKDYG
jgi:threonine aldolase